MAFSDTYIRAFEEGAYLIAEQKGSHLLPIFEKLSILGKSDSIRRMGRLSMIQRAGGNYSNADFTEIDSDFRFVTMSIFDLIVPISKVDIDRMAFDPMNSITERVGSAIGKKVDEIALAALIGSASTGEVGGGSAATLPAGNTIAVNDHTFDSGSGNVGLTVGKLLNARQIIDTARKSRFIMDERLFVFANPYQMAKLASDDRFVNGFYNSEKPLAGGMYNGFLNMEFIQIGDGTIVDSSAGHDQVIVADSRALKIAMPPVGMSIRIEDRPDKVGFVKQVKAELTVGSVRLEDELVVNILCLDA